MRCLRDTACPIWRGFHANKVDDDSIKYPAGISRTQQENHVSHCTRAKST